MGEVVNFNRERKRRLGAEKKREAEANVLKHGRTGGERRIAETQAESERRRLDGKIRIRELHSAPPADAPPDPDAD